MDVRRAWHSCGMHQLTVAMITYITPAEDQANSRNVKIPVRMREGPWGPASIKGAMGNWMGSYWGRKSPSPLVQPQVDMPQMTGRHSYGHNQYWLDWRSYWQQKHNQKEDMKQSGDGETRGSWRGGSRGWIQSAHIVYMDRTFQEQKSYLKRKDHRPGEMEGR